MNQKIQEIINNIEAARSNVYAAVNDLTQTQLDFKPSPGEWSIGEILSHLQTVEKGLPKLYSMLLKKAEDAGLKPDSTAQSWLDSLDQFQLDIVQERMPAPERVLPQTGLSKTELLDSLKQSRQAVIDAASQIGDYDLSEVKFPHPFLGEINFYQWILFVGKHEQRHLSQIAGIKALENFPK